MGYTMEREHELRAVVTRALRKLHIDQGTWEEAITESCIELQRHEHYVESSAIDDLDVVTGLLIDPFDPTA